MLKNNNLLQSLKMNIDRAMYKVQNNMVFVGAGAAFALACVGGFFVYRHFDIQKEQAAHTILEDCLAQADEAAQGKAEWVDVAAMCHAGYEKFSKTKVAPYILAVEVDALLADQKQQEALERLDLMISRVGDSSPLYPMYTLKQALLKLDMAEPALQEAGFASLEKLAADTKNIYNDAAQYYLGLYYRQKGDQQKAVDVWQHLVAINENLADKQASSPWAAMAQEKINGLIA